MIVVIQKEILFSIFQSITKYRIIPTKGIKLHPGTHGSRITSKRKSGCREGNIISSIKYSIPIFKSHIY